jgi:phage-related protein
MAYPYELHKWEAERVYELGDVVRAKPAKNNTLGFKCIVAGTTATLDTYDGFPNQEPSFPFKITQKLKDGEVTWEAFEPLAEELLRLAPTAVIDLFEVYLTPAMNDGPEVTLYYHAGKNGLTEDIKFNSQTYSAVPVEVDGFEFSARGTLPRPTLKVANVNNAITQLMLTYNPLGAKVQRIRTFAKFIDTTNFNQQVPFAAESDVADALTTEGNDSLIMQTFNDTSDPNAKIVETWYIDRVSGENQQFVEFELSPKIDLINISLPRRTIEEFCPWDYKGEECNYKDSKCFTVNDARIPNDQKIIENGKVVNDICGKRLSSCQKRFGTDVDLPYGGFYGARLQA